MKVFISWSGEISKKLAEVFRDWIPSVIQAAKPYFSPDDIAKGARWSGEISKELEQSRIGLLFLTWDNLAASWIMFEAGVLSKNIDKSKVCPILFDLEPTDIQGPLVQFQAARFKKDEIYRVIKMINRELGESALVDKVLENVFEVFWPKLNEMVESILKAPIKGDKSVRTDRDIMEEILKLARESSNKTEKIAERISQSQKQSGVMIGPTGPMATPFYATPQSYIFDTTGVSGFTTSPYLASLYSPTQPLHLNKQCARCGDPYQSTGLSDGGICPKCSKGTGLSGVESK
jgi:hypothetical protein